MDESPFVKKNMPNIEEFINTQAKVCNFVNTNKKWNLHNLKNIIPDAIINKISMIQVSVNNIEDKLTWSILLIKVFC